VGRNGLNRKSTTKRPLSWPGLFEGLGVFRQT
jgi:hypothetical protein